MKKIYTLLLFHFTYAFKYDGLLFILYMQIEMRGYADNKGVRSVGWYLFLQMSYLQMGHWDINK